MGISLGRTALRWACEAGEADLVDLLLDLGHDPLLPDAQGESPIHGAVLRQWPAVVKQLVKRCPAAAASAAENARGFHPLHTAVLVGDAESVRVLVRAPRCDLSALTGAGQSVLHLAQARYGKILQEYHEVLYCITLHTIVLCCIALHQFCCIVLY